MSCPTCSYSINLNHLDAHNRAEYWCNKHAVSYYDTFVCPFYTRESVVSDASLENIDAAIVRIADLANALQKNETIKLENLKRSNLILHALTKYIDWNIKCLEAKNGETELG